MRRKPYLHTAFSAILTISVAAIASGEDRVTPEGFAILKAAKAAANSSSKITVETDGPGSIKTYILNEKDGTRLTRKEMFDKGPPTSSPSLLIIVNREGRWELYPKSRLAVNTKFLASMKQSIAASLPLSSSEKGSPIYSLKEALYIERPCYKVTVTVAPLEYKRRLNEAKVAADSTYSALKSQVLSSSKIDKSLLIKAFTANPVDVTKQIPLVTVYLIDKELLTIWDTSAYNQGGELINRTTYSSVLENAEFPRTLFDIPQGWKIEEVNTFAQYQALKRK